MISFRNLQEYPVAVEVYKVQISSPEKVLAKYQAIAMLGAVPCQIFVKVNPCKSIKNSCRWTSNSSV